MTAPDESERKNKKRAARIRARKLSQIDQLRDGKMHKHLEGKTRLRAALFVRSQYDRLLRPKGLFGLDEITAQLSKYEGIAPGLKLHRWMLRSPGTDITPEIEAKYRKRPEPQKKTKVYLRLVAALAEIGGQDPEDAMIAFMDKTGLSDRLSLRPLEPIDDDLDPRLRLSDLLRHHAAHTAECFDLGSLFERAERLQAGWNPDRGPDAMLLEDAFQRFTPASVFSGNWELDALPPLPAVAIASIPFGHLEEARFVLEPTIGPNGGGPNGEDSECSVGGTATAYWHLHLAIAPHPGGGVLPCLLRTTRLSVELLMVDGALVTDFEVHPHTDGLHELIKSNQDSPSIELRGRRQIRFDEETSKLFLELHLKDQLYRKPRRNDETDEEPHHESIPLARLAPVTPQSIQDWLVDDLDLSYAEVESSPELSAFEDPSDAERAWFVGRSLARNLELAIRHDALQARFAEWVARFSASLEALEERHRSEMMSADLRLLARWRAEREAIDRMDDDE